MNIIEETKNLFQLCDIACSERVKVLQLNIKQTANQMPQFDDLIRYYHLFNDRDQVNITITNPDDQSLQISETTEKGSYDQFLSIGEEDDELAISIYVNKEIVKETLSVYCYSLFTQDLLSNSFGILNLGKNFDLSGII